MGQNIQSGIRVHAEFCKTMPMCQNEKELQDTRIVWFGEKTIENWDRTLHRRCQPALKSIESFNAHLQQVLVIVSSHFPQL